MAEIKVQLIKEARCLRLYMIDDDAEVVHKLSGSSP
jgi:hypothetical protein